MAQGRTNTAKWIESAHRWQINVQRDGKRRTFTSSTPGRRGQREANQKADEWISGEVISGATPVRKLFEKYTEYIHDTRGTSFYLNTKSLGTTWIIPHIGAVKIDNLTEGHLQEVLDRAKKAGKSKSTITNIRVGLGAFVKWMRQHHYCALHMDDIITPKASAGIRTILQPDSIRTLLSSAETVRYGKPCPEPLIHAFRLQVVTGLRPGENIALRWEDLDGDILHVRRSFNAYKETTIGKNENARRDIALSPLAASVLADRRSQAEQDGDPLDGNIFLLDGLPVTQEQYRDHWKRYRDHNGLEDVTTYELRHTFISMMKDIPEGYLKKIVGHSKTMDTYGVYSHDMDGDAQRAADMVQERLLAALSKVV